MGLMLSICLGHPELLNISKEPWIPRDYIEMDVARARCSSLYNDAPCLKKFIKVRELTYRAICGI